MTDKAATWRCILKCQQIAILLTYVLPSHTSTLKTYHCAKKDCTTKMLYHCSTCNRSFGSQQAYNQHVQNSPVHKTSVPKISNVQPSASIQSQSLQPSNSNLSQRTGLRQRDAVTPSSSIPHVTNQSKESPGQDFDHRWSVVPISEQLAVLDALLQNCHSSNDLQTNNYRLQPCTPEYLAGLRKCRNCGGMFRGFRCYISVSPLIVIQG